MTLRSRQHGFAIVLMLLVLISAGAYFLLRSLNQATRTNTAEVTTQRALQVAREALIGYAVRYPDNPEIRDADAGPGHLPCPDTRLDVGDEAGQADPPCATSSRTETGRFPWRTLDVVETRDGSGAPLWYAVSNMFRNNPKTIPLNSETIGTTLGLDACAAGGDDIAAVIIAPGPAVKDQDRGTVRTEAIEDIAEYLEGENADAGDGCFSTIRDAAHNDIVLALTRRDLMQAVERRVLSDVKKALTRYYADPDGDDVNEVDPDCPIASPRCDDGYPWLSPFTDPTKSNYLGTPGTRRGQLPLRRLERNFAAPFTARWSIPAAGTLTSSGTPPLAGCLRSSADPGCTFESATPPIALAEDVLGITGSDWLAGVCRARPDRVLRCTATRVMVDSMGQEYRREYQFVLTAWAYRLLPATTTSTRRQVFSLTGAALANDGRVSITLTDCKREPDASCSIVGAATLALSGGEVIDNFELLDVPFDLEIDNDGVIGAPFRSPGELPQWLVANRWEQLILVAFAEAHGPGDDATDCVGHASGCLTVHWTREPAGAPVTLDSVAATVLLAGQRLQGAPVTQSRPSALLSDYFEADNAIDDSVFAKRPPAADFNDASVILNPNE